MVLAEDTLQVTAGKENCAGTCDAGNTGFLPIVQGGPGSSQLRRPTAEAHLACQAVHMAFAGAYGAVGHKIVDGILGYRHRGFLFLK